MTAGTHRLTTAGYRPTVRPTVRRAVVRPRFDGPDDG